MYTILFNQVREIIKTLQLEFSETEIQIEDHINDYIDSITMLDLLPKLEETFHVIFEPANINPYDFSTFNRLCALIERLQKS